jgi:hypothetical protein
MTETKAQRFFLKGSELVRMNIPVNGEMVFCWLKILA